MQHLIKDKVQYKIFDRTFKDSTHFYSYNSEITDTQVNKNREIVKKHCKANYLYTLKQVHGADIVEILNTNNSFIEEEGDAIITNLNQVAIGVKTADFLPLMLCTDSGSVIAAIHCSSKSARLGIIEKTIKRIYQLENFHNLYAAIGPSIKKDSYEVRQDFYNSFIEQSESNIIFFEKFGDEKYCFDLPAYVIAKLKEYDVKIENISNEDTYLNPEKYPSHRFSSKKNEKYQGSILSVIMKCL
jgi:hypothetical protein